MQTAPHDIPATDEEDLSKIKTGSPKTEVPNAGGY